MTNKNELNGNPDMLDNIDDREHIPFNGHTEHNEQDGQDLPDDQSRYNEYGSQDLPDDHSGHQYTYHELVSIVPSGSSKDSKNLNTMSVGEYREIMKKNSNTDAKDYRAAKNVKTKDYDAVVKEIKKYVANITDEDSDILTDKDAPPYEKGDDEVPTKLLGRPACKFIPFTYDELEHFGSVGLSIENIAYKCGLGVVAFKEYCRNDPFILISIQRGLSHTIEAIGDKMIGLAKTGHLNAMIFVLKTKGNWQEKQDSKTEITISNVTTNTTNKVQLLMRTQDIIAKGVPTSEWPKDLLEFNNIKDDSSE